jgi:hypothetical protein
MASILRVSGRCPACGACGQRIGVLGFAKRSCALICRQCQATLYSDLGWSSYLLLILYLQVMVFIFGLPFMLALVSGKWLAAALALALLLLVTVPVGMALHARVIRTRFDL